MTPRPFHVETARDNGRRDVGGAGFTGQWVRDGPEMAQLVLPGPIRCCACAPTRCSAHLAVSCRCGCAMCADSPGIWPAEVPARVPVLGTLPLGAAGGALGTWRLVDLPIAVLYPDGRQGFFRLDATRHGDRTSGRGDR